MSTPSPLIPWTAVKGLSRSKLDTLIEQRRTAKEELDEKKAALDAINNKIFNVIVAADVKTVGVEGTRVTLVPGGETQKLDKKKLWTRLLELGVKEKTVVTAFADSTKKGKDRSPYIKITEPGEKDEEEE